MPGSTPYPEAAQQTAALCVQFIKHWTVVQATGAYSGDDVNIHDLLDFLSTKWWQLNKAVKGIKFHTLQNSALFGLLIVVSNIGHHRSRKQPNSWSLYIRLWNFLQNLQEVIS